MKENRRLVFLLIQSINKKIHIEIPNIFRQYTMYFFLILIYDVET